MMPIVHFIISIGIAFCLEYKHKRQFAAILVLGILGTLPDIDHFLSADDSVRALHNTFFLGVVPLALVISSNLLETNRTPSSSVYQRFFICATVVLLCHLLLDLIAGNTVFLGIPYSHLLPVNVGAMPLLESSSMGLLVTGTDMLWVALSLAVISGNRVLKAVYGLYEGYAAESQSIERSIDAENDIWSNIAKHPKPGYGRNVS